MDVLIAHGGEASRRGLAEVAAVARTCDVHEAADGPEALEALLADEPPRVALVDWDLPRIEGPELCRLVRDFHVVDPPYVDAAGRVGAPRRSPAGLAGRRARLRAHAGHLRGAPGARRDGAPRSGAALGAGDASGRPRRARPGVLLARGRAVQRLDAELPARAGANTPTSASGILDVDGLAPRQRVLRARAAGDAVLREVGAAPERAPRPTTRSAASTARSSSSSCRGPPRTTCADVLHRLRPRMSASCRSRTTAHVARRHRHSGRASPARRSPPAS